MNHPKPEALVFDFDGTIVNTEPIYWSAARELARRHGVAHVPQETLNRMMGIGRLHSMQILVQECGIRGATPEQLLVDREDVMARLYEQGNIEPMAGVREILAQFEPRLKFAIATNSAKRLVDIALPKLGIANCLAIVQTGDDIARGKPDPEIYLKAMSRLQIEPARCVVLEDTEPGCVSGHRAGSRVIGVPNALTRSQNFSIADATVNNLFEAADVIERWFS